MTPVSANLLKDETSPYLLQHKDNPVHWMAWSEAAFAKAKAEGKPIPSTVVTLLVTPEDAERISLAANQGQITLTLRNPLDVVPTSTSGVRMANLLAAPAPPVTVKNVEGRRVAKRPSPPPAPAPAPAPKIYTVEAIRGAKRTEEPVK